MASAVTWMLLLSVPSASVARVTSAVMASAVTWMLLLSAPSASLARFASRVIAREFCSMCVSASVKPFCTSTTFWWIPVPSTMISLSSVQFGLPSASTPTMPSATIATWSFVSSNHAWSSLDVRTAPRPPRLVALILSAMIRVTSSTLFASVIRTTSG